MAGATFSENLRFANFGRKERHDSRHTIRAVERGRVGGKKSEPKKQDATGGNRWALQKTILEMVRR